MHCRGVALGKMMMLLAALTIPGCSDIKQSDVANGRLLGRQF